MVRLRKSAEKEKRGPTGVSVCVPFIKLQSLEFAWTGGRLSVSVNVKVMGTPSSVIRGDSVTAVTTGGAIGGDRRNSYPNWLQRVGGGV